MATQLFIIGTAHGFKCGGLNCTSEQSEEFASELRSVCKTYGVRRMAEEMTADGRKYNKVNETVVHKVAREMDICHQDIDLDLAARQALAITDDTVLRASQTLPVNDAGEKFAIALDDLRNEIRERVWVARVLKEKLWPVLVVIGANHVQTFGMLWGKFGVTVKVLHKDWGQNEG